MVLWAIGFHSLFAKAAVEQKIVTGKVTGIAGTQITFLVGSAAIYMAQAENVILARKNGTGMQFSEILLGDKIEVSGLVRQDNTIAASYIKDLSLYAHTGTASGKVGTINVSAASFTLVNKERGVQNIHTDGYTVFKKNKIYAALADLEPGMGVSVKGSWERNGTDVFAKEVQATQRLIDIYFTGSLMVRGNTALTVVSENNVIYAIDIANAQLQSKNGKPMTAAQFNMSDALRVWGKHVSGSPQIIASRVKDANISK